MARRRGGRCSSRERKRVRKPSRAKTGSRRKRSGARSRPTLRPRFCFATTSTSFGCPARESRGLKALRKDRERMRSHVTPLLGLLPMQEIGQEELRELVEQLDAKIHDPQQLFGWKTARHVWMMVK